MVKHATIADVARMAGVSVATVSRVMNGSSRVQPATLERVREAASTLDYVPSTTARNLSLGRTRAVSLLVPDLSNPMFQQVLRGTHRAAAAAGYRLLVSDSVEEPGAEAALALESRRHSDALILCAPRMSDDDLTRVLDIAAPVVLVNRRPREAQVPVLLAEYDQGMGLLVRRLLQLGHRRLVYLSGPTTSISNQIRVDALARIADEHPDLQYDVLPCGSAIEDGSAAMCTVLESGATAVVAYNDVVALGLMARLSEAGVTVPDDISVVGYDDIPFARYATPPLTTVSVPHETLGRYAWDMVERRLAGDQEAPFLAFAPRLMDRGSTGPVPRTARPRSIEHADVDPALGWRRDDDDVAADLTLGGAVLIRYERRPVMPSVYSPRPYLHPVSTLDGVVLTTATAQQIRHQHGLSVALPWVDGVNYWGGRTHVTGAGPVLLPDHGSQASLEINAVGPETAERLLWQRPDGTPHLHERRRISAALAPAGDGWDLRWRSVLTPAGAPVEIHTPSIDGRSDARYGGIFWRFPSPDSVTISCADGIGGRAAHGSRSPWLALSRSGPKPWTVVLQQPHDRVPWHVRYENYLAVCPAIAWDGPIHLAADDDLELSLDAVVLDRVIEPAEIPSLLETR